jgi:glycosyltransferase involved in cell wall biosynthesis
MNSRHGGVELDLRPLQGGDSGRGIGATVRGVAGCFPDAGAILWRGLTAPVEAEGRPVTLIRGPRRPSRMSWAADAMSSRAGRDRSGGSLWHLMNHDVSYDGGARYVVTINDTIPWRFPDLYPAGPTGRLRMALTARMARRARMVVTPSRVSADDVIRFLKVPARRVEIIPWAADPAMTQPVGGLAEQAVRERMSPLPRYPPPRYIVMAGGFAHHDPRKRYEDAARALVGLPDDLMLYVTGGDGPAAPALREAARDAGVGERVFLTGHLDMIEMRTLYAGAAAFVFPSLWEGFGLPLLDAFSLSVPAVVSDGGSLPEIAGGAALVYPAGDVAALTAHLLCIVENPAVAMDLGSRGQARSREFSWSSTGEMYRSVYKEAMR